MTKESYSEAEARELIRQSVVDGKLIEEAAKAIGEAREVVIPRGDGYVSVTDADNATLARAALAVFEKALGEATVTPTAHEVTTDEREALTLLIEYAPMPSGGTLLASIPQIESLAEAILAAGFRRSEVPEPTADDSMSHYTDPADPFWQSNPEPQGEPSLEQVDVFVRAINDNGFILDRSAVRAGLSAVFSMVGVR